MLLRFPPFRFAVVSLAVLIVTSQSLPEPSHPDAVVPLCSKQITFKASYLVETKPGMGPSYLFKIENDTSKPIRLAEPIPSSAHWYARVGSKWLWRASSGAGGSYVNALSEKGELFAYQPRAASEEHPIITIPAHGSHEWTAGEHEIAALAYRPSCAICNNPGEHDYRGVFAYAFVPLPEQRTEGLLPCGLRTALVEMPPKEIAAGK
ncbi:hypothetical protein [Silvibacterium acidisoli]|uniref:hypothetical protein n=1 Tax=Acidobacteriaceae bacterium ZG23-2 TaxID=2883246 RepID=UPI00406C99E3